MPTWLAIAWLLAGFAVAGYAGYLIGRAHGWSACEAEAERRTRIDPPPRTPGQPTANMNIPARTARPRWRSSRFIHGSGEEET